MDIRKGRGSSVLYNIRGDDICEGRGSTPVANVTGRMSNVDLAAVIIALG